MNEPQEPRGTSTEHPAPEELSELAFSPEAAAEGLREHVAGCPGCAAEVADLRIVLRSLAELPEPVVPVSVGIRLDAAIERAWQEADARQHEEAARVEADAAAAVRSGASRRVTSWRKLLLPLSAVCLVALAVVGAGRLLGGSGSSSSSAGSAADAPAAGPGSDPALTQWVQSVLPSFNSVHAGPAVSPQAGRGTSSRSSAAQCTGVPPHAGYSELTISRREFHGEPATLVVYQNNQEPASRPLFAVVYAGSCPTASSSVVLDEGFVSR